jgi:hypothetical protein
MKYHINPERGPMKCTATKRPCKYAGGEHYDSVEKAREAFDDKLKKDFDSIPAISKKTVKGFENSKVVDSEGKLLEVYHGSAIEFSDFNPEFTGGGNDSYGSGFYFNTDKDTASGYGDFLKKVNLNITNPIRVDGYADLSLNEVYIPREAARKILRSVPNVYNQPDSEDMNPLGDYIPEFWDKEHHTKVELEKMMDKVAREYFNDPSFVEMEHMFDGADTEKFRRALHDATGWDGVEVKFEELKSSHWIAWFPEQIKSIEE